MSDRTDPVEAIIEAALIKAGIEYERADESHVRLDFRLSNGVYIECKAFHSPRSADQLSRAPNVVLVQGVEAARWFAEAICGGPLATKIE